MTTKGSERQVHILLIEDDQVHARIVARALRYAGAGVHLQHVSDGAEAMRLLLEADQGRRDGPDLVLLDLRLPGLDGFGLLKAVKMNEHLQTTPVIIVSTSDRACEIRRCYELGANAYVTKPLDFQDFSRCVQSVVQFWLEAATLPARCAS